MKREQIDTGKAFVCLTKEGHVLIQIHEDQEIDINDIKAINAAKFNLVKEEPYTVIFVTPVIGDITHQARLYSASKEVNKNAIAKAIVSNSLAGRIISSFFINIIRPPAPTKLFSCKHQASEWLNNMCTRALKNDLV